MSRKKKIMIVIIIVIVIIVIKWIWVCCATRHQGTLEKEKKEIYQRQDYLLNKVVVTDPMQLINEMPKAVGSQFQGEWALYSCSMLSASLVNTTLLYKEKREFAIAKIDSLIQIVLSPELRAYDLIRWNEDPLESLDGSKSHISYISHLAWMIGGYKRIGGDGKYDKLYHSLCEAMNRRILASPNLNLPTYPGEYIYVPDMLVAIVALKIYSQQNNGKYSSTVKRWVDEAKSHMVDKETGLIASFLIPDDTVSNRKLTIKGSYTALSCYYLTFIDEEFACDQYMKLKTQFLKKHPRTGVREYYDRKCWLGMDIDAGPIIFNLSPTGTAFAVGSATYFKDNKLRKKLLKTGEIAGSTLTWNGRSHYLLANIALVGEAIMLAMRTATDWRSVD